MMNIRPWLPLAATVGGRSASLYRLVKGLLWCVLPGIILCGASSVAAQEVPLSLSETARQADAIVLGTISAKQSRWGDPSQRWMVTDYALTVESVIYSSEKAEPVRTTVTLTYWGGTIGSETQAIADVRLPVVGERLLLFLRPNWAREVSFTPVVGLNQGLFIVTPDVAGVGALVREAFGEPLELTASGDVVRRPDGLANTRAVSIETFIDWLRGNINSIKAMPSEWSLAFDRNDPRVMRTFAKQPSLLTKSSDDRSIIAARAPFESTGAEPSARVPMPLSPSPKVLFEQPRTALYGNPIVPNYVTEGPKPNLPIVVNNFPDSFAPWSPEDEYQMSKWNYYASDVFRVYTTPTGTYSWPDGVFDLAGWPSSADLQRVYGSGWSSNTVGITFYRYSGSTMTEADIALNPAFGFTLDDEWILNGAGNVQSFRLTMLHELGHMHGLDHNFNFLAVMNYFPSVYRFFELPYMDDAQGIRALYSSRAVSRTDLGVYLYYASGFQSVSDATYPSSVVAGGSISPNNYHVENVGTTTISTPTIEWYLSSARNYNSSYYYLGSATYPSLPPFTYFTPSTVQRTFTVPASVPPGFYYLGAFIRDDGGTSQSNFPFSNNFAFSRFQIQVLSGGGTLNLTPYQPAGWSDKIVVSKTTGTSTDSSGLLTTDTLYVDWAVLNNGSANITSTFNEKLYVDGVEKQIFTTSPPLNSNSYTFYQDYSIGSLSAGTHTIKIVADSGGAISESNEFDNEYTKTITVTGGQSCNLLTANVSPNGGGTVSFNVAPNCSTGSAAPETAATDQPSTLVADVRSSVAGSRSAAVEATFDELISKAEASGSIKVIVGLNVPYRPEGMLSASAETQEQRNSISESQDRVLSAISNYDQASLKRYSFIPAMALKVDADGLRRLEASSDVTTIAEDKMLPLALAESVPLIGAPAAWSSGFSGSGQTVAILDTGVDKTHSFLSGKVVSEACYSMNLCPGGGTSSTSPGSGVNCNVSIPGCDHGTHVAGIAAGKGSTFSGVAKDASIIAIQVFTQNANGSLGAYDSDIISGLQRVQALSSTYQIAAVNLSLGGGLYTANCDSTNPSFKSAVDSLRSFGIATVIASGNDGSSTSISYPACISTAVSVGSTDDGSSGTVTNAISSFSNSASILKLLAPGRYINSSIPGGGFANFQGTSMATPHVVGAWAVLKSKSNSASVDTVLNALTSTGLSITDSRNGITKPRIKVDAAVNALAGGFSGQYTSGTVVTLTPVPNTGYSFQSWSGCDSVSGNTCTATMNSSKTVTANFTPTQVNYTITVSASPIGVGTVSGGGTFAAGSSRTVTATANAGYTFVNWTENGGVVSSSSSYNFTLNGNRNLVANFATQAPVPTAMRAVDYDGDHKMDLEVWRASTGVWYIINSSNGSVRTQPWGAQGDIPVGGDFDGDSKADVAIWRPSTGIWYIINSSNGSVRTQPWGAQGDIPVSGDFDGDSKADIAVWRPSTGIWYIINSSNGSVRTQPWGTLGDIPVSGNFDGDNKADIAVWRPSTGVWYIINSSNGSVRTQPWGTLGDIPVSGDFDGDGKADIAVWRPSTGVWYIINSSNGSVRTQSWGTQGDVPIRGDFDNDGKTDLAVWRPLDGGWYIINSSNGSVRIQSWGNQGLGDVPGNQ